MASPGLANAISHWSYLFEDWQESSDKFYSMLEEAIKSREIPGISLVRVTIPEGGMFSAKRVYLRITRKKHVFDICAAPFAKGFFVSWWLAELPGCIGALLQIPVLNVLAWVLVRPVTYYKIDTALMFQSSIHAAVMEVIDQMTTTKNARKLETEERKPVLKQMFA